MRACPLNVRIERFELVYIHHGLIYDWLSPISRRSSEGNQLSQSTYEHRSAISLARTRHICSQCGSGIPLDSSFTSCPLVSYTSSRKNVKSVPLPAALPKEVLVQTGTEHRWQRHIDLLCRSAKQMSWLFGALRKADPMR